MEDFLKSSCNRCFKLTFIFKMLTLSITVEKKKGINCITGIGIIHATVQIKKTKASAGLCRISLDAVCYHVTSPAMSRYDTVNLTTD